MNLITLFDIGASCEINKNLKRVKNSKIIGFDPDKDEIIRLNKLYKNSNVELFPYAIGSGSEDKLFLTKRRTCSSLREPDINSFRQFDSIGSERNRRGDVDKALDIKTITLDDFVNKHGITPDFVKIDTQGTEYEILEKYSFKYLLGLEIEVEFIQLYKDQKLFRDIDALMAENGFRLFGMKRNRMKINDGETFRKYVDGGVLVHADVLYFKEKEILSDEQREKVCRIAEAYDLIDLAMYYYPNYRLKRKRFREIYNFFRGCFYYKLHRDRKTVVDFDKEYHI